MREIKFRAWDKLNKTMEPVWLIDYWQKELVTQNSKNDLSNFEIMQFTGLKDSNGNEIFEGDIVTYGTEDDIVTAKLEYRDTEDEESMFVAGFCLIVISNIEYPDDDDRDHSLEIIGNIYENPELLGETK